MLPSRDTVDLRVRHHKLVWCPHLEYAVRQCQPESGGLSFVERLRHHGNLAYSACASLTTGISASASFQSCSNSSYALLALSTSPAIVQALASCSRASAPIGSSSRTPGWSRIFWNSAAASPGLPSATYDKPRT